MKKPEEILHEMAVKIAAEKGIIKPERIASRYPQNFEKFEEYNRRQLNTYNYGIEEIKADLRKQLNTETKADNQK